MLGQMGGNATLASWLWTLRQKNSQSDQQMVTSMEEETSEKGREETSAEKYAK